METISRLQKLLDESKFFEAQKESELILLQSDDLIRKSVLKLYLSALRGQSKTLPPDLLVEYVEVIALTEPEQALELLAELSSTSQERYRRRILLQKILITEIRGLTSELYQHISALQLHAYSRKIPSLPSMVLNVSEKYFHGDFTLGLQRLSLNLLKGDLVGAEKIVHDLIFSSIERSTPKGTREKLISIAEVLNGLQNYSQLEVYRNLCLLLADGVREKQDYKRLSELVIYADDFRLQVLILSLLDKYAESVAPSYARAIREHSNYTFVYFDKYFPQLKRYFVTLAAVEPALPEGSLLAKETRDFDLAAAFQSEAQIFDFSDEEIMVARLIRHGTYDDLQLLDLAVGFLQSEFPRAAVAAADLIIRGEGITEEKLKASYLKLTALLMLKDFRQALDLSFEALKYAKTQNDVLSFLYAKSEAHLALGEKKAAKATLNEIVALDADYRLARQKLERLNEV